MNSAVYHSQSCKTLRTYGSLPVKHDAVTTGSALLVSTQMTSSGEWPNILYIACSEEYLIVAYNNIVSTSAVTGCYVYLCVSLNPDLCFPSSSG